MMWTAERARRWTPPLTFMVFAACYALLRSNDLTRVDGALRCLDPFTEQRALFHGNNHLLYPLWVTAWVTITGWVSPVALPIEIVHRVQLMNALLGASAVGLLSAVLCRLTTLRLAVLGTMAFALSTAMTGHAVNSAEPLAGFFFAALGLYGLIRASESRAPRLPAAAAGLAFALALASYQAMAAVIGMAVLLTVWRAQKTGGRTGLAILGWTSVSGVVAVVLVYSAAYAYQGVPRLDMLRAFFALGGAPEVYSGFTIGKLLNVPFGLVKNSLGLLSSYGGLRTVPELPVSVVASAAGGFVLLIALALVAVPQWLRALRSGGSTLCAAAALACGVAVFPLVYWDPLYDKLWLAPLAFALSAVAIGSAVSDKSRRNATILLGFMIGVELLQNAPAMLRQHRSPTPSLAGAEQLREWLRPGDRVVLDFDEVSTLWLALLRDHQEVLMLPSSDVRAATQWLEAPGPSGGGRLVFVSVLDHDRAVWDQFLGRRVGIPFELLETYRRGAVTIGRVQGRGGPISVRVYNMGSPS